MLPKLQYFNNLCVRPDHQAGWLVCICGLILYHKVALRIFHKGSQRFLYFTILLLLITLIGRSQNLSNLRNKTISPLNDTLLLDSLSIVPGSELIFDYNNNILSKSQYNIDYAKSLLILSKSILKTSNNIRIAYRVFPVNFTKETYKRKKEETFISGPVLAYPDKMRTDNRSNFLTDNQLDKRGSISRGITIGNNQDAVINSNLNLQISGKLSNDMYILAAISDENIPIQPDGNSQQIQDFDKVFIQLYNDNTKLIAGDFEIHKPTGYFMNVNKKGQGGLLNYKTKNSKNKPLSYETTISGAISKGKYCKKTFQGQEGNQGPYKLTGCENEQFIIVLSGSEKVYINGKLQTRGKEYDYTIDYNTGEITFTANKPITKDSRIAIEFEYSEKSYSRFIIYNSNEFKTQKGKFWLNVFSEQDSKNQAINQDLTNEQKRLLSEAGDNIGNAFVPNIDSVDFRNDYVLYEKTDTIIGGVSYEIYKYSTNPEKAIYQVGFSLVGNEKGNYIQIQNSANGKVFEWIAPINNIPQGNYEPVRLLISPKKQQMISLGGEFNFNKSTHTNFEFALSNYDINTFSTKDASDNTGYAIKFDVENNWFNSDTLKNSLKSRLSYHLINKNFTSIERFRTIEFERDWNIQTPFISDEHFAQIDLSYKHKKSFISQYGLGFLSSNSEYTGYKNILNASINKSGYALYLNSSLLNTNSDLHNTQFVRYLINGSKSFKQLRFGLENELEQNKWNNNITDSLQKNSFSFSSYRIYLENSDSTTNTYTISYTLRDNYLPTNNELEQSTQSEDFRIGFGLLKNPASILRTSINYRKLHIIDTSIVQDNEENSLTGRLDYTFRVFKGAISSSSFYEAGSGLEPKREFSYLKVTNGQGVYAWADYNNNGVAELDEFENAQFQDQANYIRIYTPGTEYIKTNKNEFSQILNINPGTVWKSKKGFKKIISRFSNNFAFMINQKSTNNDFNSLNPFYTSSDSTIINLNQNIRNTFSFNKTNSKFGVDYIYQKTRSKLLLSNGIDEREKFLNAINIRWRFFDDFTFQNKLGTGNKIYKSEFFSTKNYKIENIINDIALLYQPGFKTRIKINYKYTNKLNSLSTEKSITHNIGAEINYSISKKGSFIAQGNYLNIDYNADKNTSLAYEMLEGLKPGNNATWSLRFQRKLAGNLELNIIYNGRASEKIAIIHTGNLQLRAFF